MKYKSKYRVIEGIRYTGTNFKEVNDFVDGKLCWGSSEMNWSDNNPPSDLKILLKCKEPVHINKGDYVVKLDNGEFTKYDEDTFEAFFKGEK